MSAGQQVRLNLTVLVLLLIRGRMRPALFVLTGLTRGLRALIHL